MKYLPIKEYKGWTDPPEEIITVKPKPKKLSQQESITEVLNEVCYFYEYIYTPLTSHFFH